MAGYKVTKKMQSWYSYGRPMDGKTAPLHAAEPGHLALGELVDGIGKEDVHLVVGEFPQHILRDEFVFKAVVPLSDSLGVQPNNL